MNYANGAMRMALASRLSDEIVELERRLRETRMTFENFGAWGRFYSR